MSRKALIAANWKMYKPPAEARAFVDAFLPLVAGHTRDEIALFPSPVLLPTVIPACKGSNVAVGAQNIHFAEEGAYTGETSIIQLKAVGGTHTLIGHSERRQYFAETDEIVNKKLHTALKHGIVPVVCIGEVLEEREAGKTASVELAGRLAHNTFVRVVDVDGQPDGTTQDSRACREPPRDKVLHAGRLAICERDGNHLVSAGRLTVPRAMQGSEERAAIALGELRRLVEQRLQRRRVRGEVERRGEHARTRGRRELGIRHPPAPDGIAGGPAVVASLLNKVNLVVGIRSFLRNIEAAGLGVKG